MCWRGRATNLSDFSFEDVVHTRFQRFLGLDLFNQKGPDETTVLVFRGMIEQCNLAEAIFAQVNAGLATQGLLLKTGTVMGAIIPVAPYGTKYRSLAWAQTGLVHAVRIATVNVYGKPS